MAEEKLDEELNEEETVAEETEDTENTGDSEESIQEEVSVEQQLQTALQEAEKWKNDYYKAYADMQNLKTRLEKEHQNSLKYMMQSFIEELLPVIDNFERSLNVENPSEEISNFLKGNEMILNQLMDILKKNGVEVIEAQGKEFDPSLHQAVMTCDDENYDSNIVVEELQKGYKLKDRVIRASLVKVNN